MKRIFLIAAMIVMASAVLGVGVVLAQGGEPPFGPGGYGWMHDYVEQALATKLGLTEEQVEEQLAAGKPMYQIALDNGLQQEALATFMNEVHQTAFDQAVKDGVLTQERADWMLQHMQNMYQGGYGPANCPMHNGQGGAFQRPLGMGPGMMSGRGPGWMWNQGTQNP